MILVTGSTGTFGSAVLKKLQENKIANRSVSSENFDWNNPKTFEKALKGISKNPIFRSRFSKCIFLKFL